MLITHGKADRRTPLAGAKKFVSALEKPMLTSNTFSTEKRAWALFDKNSMINSKIEKFLPNVIRKPLNKRS